MTNLFHHMLRAGNGAFVAVLILGPPAQAATPGRSPSSPPILLSQAKRQELGKFVLTESKEAVSIYKGLNNMADAAVQGVNNIADAAVQAHKDMIARREAANQAVLADFGAETLKNADATIRNGSKLAKTRFLYTEYCKRLDAGGTPVNTSLASRGLQWFTHYDSARWTCADHTGNLLAVMRGAGLQVDTVGLQTTSALWYDYSLNCNHGAMLLRDDDGELYMFDPWWMAVANAPTINPKNLPRSGIESTGDEGTGGRPGAKSLYDSTYGTKFNGMRLADWEKLMKENQYGTFSVDQGYNNRPTALEALEQWLRGFDLEAVKASSGQYTGSFNRMGTLSLDIIKGYKVKGAFSFTFDVSQDTYDGTFTGTINEKREITGTVKATCTSTKNGIQTSIPMAGTMEATEFEKDTFQGSVSITGLPDLSWYASKKKN